VPSLATTEIPDAAVIAADPGHCNIAAYALIRAVLFDDLGLDHPAVSNVLDALARVAEAEVPGGGRTGLLTGRVRAGGRGLGGGRTGLAHRDPRHAGRGARRRRPGLDGRIAADALIGAFPYHFECEYPGDAELLERLADFHGDVIVNLVRPGAVKPADALQVGLRLLSALDALCRSDSVSLLQPTA
jgi:hypothetical protein